MADVTQKIKSGESQPKPNFALASNAGAKALTSSEKTTTNILYANDLQQDQPVALTEVKLDGKFDDKTYYTT